VAHEPAAEQSHSPEQPGRLSEAQPKAPVSPRLPLAGSASPPSTSDVLWSGGELDQRAFDATQLVGSEEGRLGSATVR
tara:strand:- start:609 stop:842 length:234 start_codon:yes stop_codon:yes gene_type:complete